MYVYYTAIKSTYNVLNVCVFWDPTKSFFKKSFFGHCKAVTDPEQEFYLQEPWQILKTISVLVML